MKLEALPPLALYVHIPWCVRKCPYCDFNSHEARGDVPETQYVDALLADLETTLPLVWGRKVVSIFIGGGTPSLFAAESIDRLLGGIRARLPIVPGAEITLEANPGTFERQKFAGFFAAGVNRLSLGVQSFDPAQLRGRERRLRKFRDRGIGQVPWLGRHAAAIRRVRPEESESMHVVVEPGG
jgi:oxygen-independent coproporphyrinogen-3 oxidase